MYFYMKKQKNWPMYNCLEWGSNLDLLLCKSGALPIELSGLLIQKTLKSNSTDWAIRAIDMEYCKWVCDISKKEEDVITCVHPVVCPLVHLVEGTGLGNLIFVMGELQVYSTGMDIEFTPKHTAKNRNRHNH